jgi:hypothetical protein
VFAITPLAAGVNRTVPFSRAGFAGRDGLDHPRIRWRDDCDARGPEV